LRLQIISGWWWEVLCCAVYLALAANQLFMRPITGLADNGDFPKVLAHLDVCDPNRERDVLQYVHPAYIIDPGCHWDSRLASSETLAFNYVVAASVHHAPLAERNLSRHVSPDVYVLIIGPQGKVLVRRPSGSPHRPDPAPLI